ILLRLLFDDRLPVLLRIKDSRSSIQNRRQRKCSNRGKTLHYLVTGGAGFIGAHLAQRLLRDGHNVTILDDLCTGSIHNIEHLKTRPGFRYIIDTIFNRPLLAELIDDSDAVFHLAASVGVRLIVESPVRTIETNVKGTECVLEFANKK